MTECSGYVKNEIHPFANASVGSQPDGIIPCGGLVLRPMVAAVTDQFPPPHVSLVLRHLDGEELAAY